MWSVLFINTYIVCKCHDKLVINLIMIGPSLLAGGRKGLHFSPLRITKNICICRDPSPPVCVHNVTAPAPAPSRSAPLLARQGRAALQGWAVLSTTTRRGCSTAAGSRPSLEWSLVTGQAAVLQCLSPEINPPTAALCPALAELKLRL